MKKLSLYKLSGVTKEQVLGSFKQNLTSAGGGYNFVPLTLESTKLSTIGVIGSKLQLEEGADPDIASFNGIDVISFKVQNKAPNKRHINTLLSEKIARIEATGDVVNKKVRQQLTEDATYEVLQLTYPKAPNTVEVMFYPTGEVFITEVGVVAESILAFLRSITGSLPIVLLEVEGGNLNDAYGDMILRELSETLMLGKKATLVDTEERKNVISCKNGTTLSGSEAEHLIGTCDHIVVQIGLNYDGVVEFLVDDKLKITGMKWEKEFLADIDPSAQLVLQVREAKKLVDELFKEINK